MPDATQMVIWSMVSDTAAPMASWRLERWLETQNRGARNPADRAQESEERLTEEQAEQHECDDEHRLDAEQLGHVDPVGMSGLGQVALHVAQQAGRHEPTQLGAKVPHTGLGWLRLDRQVREEVGPRRRGLDGECEPPHQDSRSDERSEEDGHGQTPFTWIIRLTASQPIVNEKRRRPAASGRRRGT